LANAPAQRFFEASHDSGVLLLPLVGLVGGNAAYDRVKQLLLKRSCDLGPFDKSMLGFGKLASLPEKTHESQRLSSRRAEYSACL
jgi:hypothetical protein